MKNDVTGAVTKRGPKPRAGEIASGWVKFRVTPAERERLRAGAERAGLSVAGLVRWAVEQALEAIERG